MGRPGGAPAVAPVVTTLRQLLPPRPAQVGALLAVLLLLAGIGIGVWLGGGLALLGLLLGVLAGLPAAPSTIPVTTRCTVGALAVAAAGLGVLTTDAPWLAGAVVGLAALVQAPLNQRAVGLGVMLPIVAAMAATVGLERWQPLLLLWVAAGFLLIWGVARVLGIRVPTATVPRQVAVRHAILVALASALAVVITMHLGLGHGYWLVLAIAVVLSPHPRETTPAATARVLGTLLGAAAALLVVALVPRWASLALAVPCLVLLLGWSFAGDKRKEQAFGTVVLVLVGSSGVVGTGVALALERVLLTGLGVLVAAGLAVLLHRAAPDGDSPEDAVQQPPPP